MRHNKMAKRRASRVRHKRVVKGGGLISSVLNKAIDLLPVEAHLPGGYQFCGPGTKLKQRLARGDKGINPLDGYCREHDIAYDRFSDSANRAKADSRLAEQAWRRVSASDASLAEKAAAWAVTTAMKTKAKFGGGRRRRKRRCRPRNGQGLYLRPYPSSSGGGGGGKVCKRRRKRRCNKKKKPQF